MNIGFGISANVPRVVLEEGQHGSVIWMIEQGAVGGTPLLEFKFGCSSNAEAFHVGRNVSIEPAVVHGYTLGFTIDFVDQESRDRYVHDPERQAIGAKLVAHCPSGLDRVLVFDLEN